MEFNIKIKMPKMLKLLVVWQGKLKIRYKAVN